MRVAFFPDFARGNPYLDRLGAALQDLGIAVHPHPASFPHREWLRAHRSEVDVLHFHWLDRFYRHSPQRDAAIRALKLVVDVLYARQLGYRLVWTVHNIYPHERPYPQLDELVRWVMVRAAHAVAVHCEAGRKAVRECFGRAERVYVAPQGNYLRVHPDAVSKPDARCVLNISPDSTVFLFLGLIRPYKALPDLVHAFSELCDPNLTLIIAGELTDFSLDAQTERVMESDPRIGVRLEHIPDNEMQYYYTAADVVACPYKQVLTSGSVMQALSFGRPVVAPALGCLPELVSPEVGVLYQAGDRRHLRQSLAACLHLELDVMGQRALEVAKSYTWHATAQAVSVAYGLDQEPL